MIQATVSCTYDGIRHRYGFDAEPWFETATPQQIAALEKDRHESILSDGPFYEGPTTYSIWNSVKHRFYDDPKITNALRNQLPRQIRTSAWGGNDHIWLVSLDDGEEVDRRIRNCKAKHAANKAVDRLLDTPGGEV